MSVEFKFNPFEELGIEVPKNKRGEALSAVADYVKEKVLSYVAEANSPVSGHGKFPALSPAYKRKKAEVHGTPIPNLELTGDMLDALEVDYRNSIVTIGIYDNTEAAKAEKHCNYDGTATKTRRFIPAPTETFKRDIWNGIREIVQDYAEEE